MIERYLLAVVISAVLSSICIFNINGGSKGHPSNYGYQSSDNRSEHIPSADSLPEPENEQYDREHFAYVTQKEEEEISEARDQDWDAYFGRR